MADIDDPFKRSDATSMRPRPGAGKWGSNEATRARPAPACPGGQSRTDWRRGARLAWRRTESTAAGGKSASAACGSIARRHLGHGCRRPQTTRARRDAPVRRPCTDRRRGERDRADRALRLVRDVGRSRLVHPWGSQSEWAQHPLLVTLHREAWGGEKFFEVLDRISRDPGRHIDLMELQYLCISFGFAGKYQTAGTRARASGRCPAGPLSQDSQPSRRTQSRTVTALARSRRPAQSSHSLCPVVGCRRCRTCVTCDRLHGVLHESGQSRGAGARAACESGARGVRGRRRPARSRSDPEATPENEESSGALSVEERGGRTVVTLLGVEPVRLGERVGEPRLSSDAGGDCDAR